MRANNTKSEKGFIFEYVWCLVIALIWYKRVFFRCIDGLSFTDSRGILIGLISACSAAGIYLQIERQRNNVSILMNLVAAFGIYTVITYLPIRRTLILTVVFSAAALTLFYALVTLFRRSVPGRMDMRILRKRMLKTARGGRNILCAGLGLIMLVIAANTAFGNALMRSSEAQVTPDEIGEQIVNDHIHTLARMGDGTWETLSVGDRLNLLQVLADIERSYLGLPHELNVGTANMSEELCGFYSDQTHEIVVSLNSLLHDPPNVLINTIAHEAYHALQHRMVDAYHEAGNDSKSLYLYRDASRYEQEFAEYIDAEKDFYGYYLQECEVDARSYAQETEYYYCNRIRRYIESGKASAKADMMEEGS